MRNNPIYLGGRLVRRIMPEWLALRLLSKRHLPVDRVYRGTEMYLKGMLASPAITDLAGWTILEAGTGVYNPASMPLLLAGINKLILLEPFAEATLDETRLQGRCLELMRMAEQDRRMEAFRRVPVSEVWAEGMQMPNNVQLVRRFWENTGLAENSVDMILSVSVLEHLRSPREVLAESARILRQGGYMIHLVDFRDHFFRYPLEMLKYTQRQWQLLTTSKGGGGYLNRWRAGDWISAMDAAGFSTRLVEHLQLRDVVEREKDDFAPEFRQRPIDELSIGAAILVCQKL